MQCQLPADRGKHRLQIVVFNPCKNEKERVVKTSLAKVSLGLATALAFVTTAAGAPSSAKACGSDPIIGDICLVSFGYCPSQYFLAIGQTLSIANYPELFSLLGTIYGGNGTSTFGLPDLRSRVPISVGHAPGQPAYTLGETGGVATVTPAIAQLTPHVHNVDELPVAATATLGGVLGEPNVPEPGFLAGPRTAIYRTAGSTDPGSIVALSSEAGDMTGTVVGDTVSTGGGDTQENRPAYLSMVYCIAYDGTYPSRP